MANKNIPISLGRARHKIEEETQKGPINEYINSRVQIELLLDIRDLLQEISWKSE